MRRYSAMRSVLPEAAVRAAIDGVLLRNRGGKVVGEAEDGYRTVAVGSRLLFRLLGKWGPGGTHRLPLLVGTAINPDSEGTLLKIRIETDEGWYLVYPAFALRFLDRVFDELEREIGSALRSGDQIDLTPADG
jgi:hypothetical protein